MKTLTTLIVTGSLFGGSFSFAQEFNRNRDYCYSEPYGFRCMWQRGLNPQKMFEDEAQREDLRRKRDSNVIGTCQFRGVVNPNPFNKYDCDRYGGKFK